MSDQGFLAGFIKPDITKFPRGWTALQLNQFCEFYQGGGLGLTKSNSYSSYGIPAFSAAGQDGFVDQAEFENVNAVILSAIGANCGRCFYAEGDWTTLANVQAIVPNDTLIAKYLFYRVNRDGYWPKSGSAQPFIKPSSAGKSWIAFPQDPNVQRKIVQILETMDQVIDKTEALIEKYEQIKAGLMHDLFSRGIGPEGKLRPRREEAPELYQETPIGWIPNDWAVKPLGSITTKIVDGVHHTPRYVEHGIPFVTVRNLTGSDTIDFTRSSFIDRQTHQACFSRADPRAGDLLVTKDGTLGVCRIVKPGMPEFSIFVSVALIKVTEELSSERLYYFFESGEFLKQLGYLSAGSGLKHIHLEHFRKFQISLPAFDEQLRINKKLKFIEGKLSTERDFLGKLKKQKLGLMHDLLSGDIEPKIDIKKREPINV